MYETADEIAHLQALMDATVARQNQHFLDIVKPERRLDAEQVVTYLRGLRHVAFATVTRRGEPRDAPLDAHFVHGRFTLGTGRDSARWRNFVVAPSFPHAPPPHPV